jgi:hypothetical protein
MRAKVENLMLHQTYVHDAEILTYVNSGLRLVMTYFSSLARARAIEDTFYM